MSALLHRVEVGARVATLSKGCRFWVVTYRSPKTGRSHNPTGYTLGFRVSPERVRHLLEQLHKHGRDFGRVERERAL